MTVASGTRVLFFTKGDRQNGMGHVIRDLVLARTLKQIGVSPEFVTLGDTPGAERILASDEFPCWCLNQQEDLWVWLNEHSELYRVIVIDIENGPSQLFVRSLGMFFQSGKVVVIGGVGFLLQDVPDIGKVIGLMVIQAGGDAENAGGIRTLRGYDYLILDPRISDECQPLRDGHVVIAMGGGDPHNLTEIALEGLCGFPSKFPRPVILITGPAREAVLNLTEGLQFPSNALHIHAPASLYPYLSGASICICALGMTAYESLCAGVPVVLANWSEDHEIASRGLENLQLGHNMGLWQAVTPERVRLGTNLMLEEKQWLQASQLGRTIIDGRGAMRVAEAIMDIL